MSAPAGEGAPRLRLFEAFGIELEYMIVDRETLDVRPLCDALLRAAAGELTSELEDGPVSWSNELALHVVELKTTEPEPRLEGVAERFGASLARVDALLAPMGARLLPTAMHPWMDPHRELRLWPHDNQEIYRAFDRIFDCRGHGWANLQSVHLNLPFADDEAEDGEFARLHAAIRVVLPLLPALAASSPFREGRATGLLDTRLDVYRGNAARVPSVSGRVVPEAVFTRPAYEREILERLYRDMAPHDPEGVLRHEWCNARGAIARFDRSAIEIRVLDVQECPQADLAIAALASAAIRALVEERGSTLAEQKAAPDDVLVRQLEACVRDAERAPLLDPGHARLLGLDAGRLDAGGAWRALAEALLPPGSEARSAFAPALDVIFDEGPLARRLLAAVGPEPSRERLHAVYGELAQCLLAGRPFRAG